MSGIAGVYHPDGRATEPARVRDALVRLGYPGVRARPTWSDGPIALGNVAFPTTPEAEREQLPLRDASSRLALTADARVDNRYDLARVLPLRQPLRDLSDAELLLAAYEHWGPTFPEHVVGAYVTAIWDTRERHLFLARDHAGFRPLYWHHVQDQQFLFASSIPGLLALGAPRRPNPERIADYLVDIVANNEYTFYRDIFRLPPGHTLTVSASGVSLRRYWSPDPEFVLDLPNDDAYAEAFRETFEEAVRVRLRSSSPPAVMLSGGLDSSSVAVVAERLPRVTAGPLDTVSKIYPDFPECDERPYIEAVLATGRYRPHFVRVGREVTPLTAARSFVEAYGQPIYAPASSTGIEMYAQARTAGLHVLLDGHGGDEVVWKGKAYLRELALSGRWIRLLGETVALGDSESQGSRAQIYLLHVLFGLADRLRSVPRMARARSALVRAVNRLNAHRTGAHVLPAAELVAPDLAASVDLPARLRSYPVSSLASARTDREAHYGVILSARQPLAFEALSAMTAAAGVERRSPFWDRRLVELCLALPADQTRRRGHGRYVLRRALRDTLPAVVLARRDKARFNNVVIQGILQNDGDELDALLRASGGGLPWVHPDVFRTALHGFKGDPTLPQAMLLLKLAGLEAWRP